jgi:hypothetical protein
LEEGIGTTRGWFAASDGGPNGPVRLEPPCERVSMTRHGVMPTKTSPGVVPAAVAGSLADRLAAA